MELDKINILSNKTTNIQIPIEASGVGAIPPTYFLPIVPFSLIEPNHDTRTYLQNLLKWICANYPSTTNGLWLGQAQPNSIGIVMIQIYNTGAVSGGLPQYSSGIYVGLSGSKVSTFGTNGYSYYYNA